MIPDQPVIAAAVAAQVEAIMEERKTWFEELWEVNNRRVNRRLLFLFGVVFLALGFSAYHSEVADRRIQNERYAACTERVAQVVAYNQGTGRDVLARIVVAVNPDLTEPQRSELIGALAAQMHLPEPRCVEP